MFAVVVLLTNPRTHCVLPEEYIFGLENVEAEMKTWGINRNHKHLVFWSRTLFDNAQDYIADQPNFSLIPLGEFPPRDEIDSACFFARIKRFFKSFEEANTFCDRFRPVLPIVYNANALMHQPTPPNEITALENSDGSFSDIEDAITSENADDDEEKFVLQPVQLNEIDSQALNDLISLVDDEQVVQNATDANVARIEEKSYDANSIENDVLDVLAQPEEEINGNGSNDNQLAKDAEECVGSLVTIERNDSTQEANQEENSHEVSGNEVTSTDNAVELDQAQSDQSSTTIVEDAVIDTEQSETADNGVPIENLTLYQPVGDEEAVRTENGSIEITKTYEDGMQMRYVLGQKICPIPSPYQVKTNDLFSGNLPFQANENNDRSFLVKVNGSFQEVKLNGRLVLWSTMLNKDRRGDNSVDKAFIKALLISVFSVKLIKSGDSFEPDLISFIKDLFANRVEGFDVDGMRLSTFDDLLGRACNDIRQMN